MKKWVHLMIQLMICKKTSKRARDDMQQIIRRRDRFEDNLKDVESDLRSRRAELADMQDKFGDDNLETVRMELARKVKTAAELLKDNYTEIIFNKLEKYTIEHWNELCYDILEYSSIKLDRENSYFEVFDNENNSRRATMNTGHRIVLVLSFISALIKIARESFKVETPMVLDAPLSEIGLSARPAFLKKWSQIHEQNILILQDGTITPEIKSEIGDKIIKFCTIEYDRENRSTIFKG